MCLTMDEVSQQVSPLPIRTAKPAMPAPRRALAGSLEPQR
ncbi:hypothetical protein SAMN05216603_12016 [Pseudomonas benzenivorans]|nr:hypothetical protein SAMN05216603_12016 [Pseudomonas benzenivorans]